MSATNTNRLDLGETDGNNGLHTDVRADSADNAGSTSPDPASHNGPSGKQTAKANTAEERQRESDVDRLLALTEGIELFHTSADIAYASVPVSSHRETHAVRRRGFKSWLLRQYYSAYRDAPSGESIQTVIRLCEARARFDGRCEEVFVRVGEKAGRVYIDLGDVEWRAIEIDAVGWRIVSAVQVRFRRPQGQRPLPNPVHGGDLEELRPFVNFANDDDWVLFVGALVSALRPRGPYFVT